VDRERRRVQLTVKKSLLRSTHPKLLRYGTHRPARYALPTRSVDAQQPNDSCVGPRPRAEDATPGMITLGTVVSAASYGCIVRFFNQVSALVPASQTGCVRTLGCGPAARALADRGRRRRRAVPAAHPPQQTARRAGGGPLLPRPDRHRAHHRGRPGEPADARHVPGAFRVQPQAGSHVDAHAGWRLRASHASTSWTARCPRAAGWARPRCPSSRRAATRRG